MLKKLSTGKRKHVLDRKAKLPDLCKELCDSRCMGEYPLSQTRNYSLYWA